MDEIVICESGACDALLHWVTPYSIDIIWLVSGTLFVGYHIRKNTPQIYFYQETVRHLWIILIIRKRRWNLWVVGISKWRHHPQQQQQTTSMADVTPVWHLFDSNVRIVERFSWLIIKTVLDRYRQVVNTNTCVLFYRYIISFSLSLPTYSKTKKQALLVWIQQLVATRRTTSPSSQGCDVIHSHFILCTCKHLYF